MDAMEHVKAGTPKNAKWKVFCATLNKVVAHDAPHSKAYGIEPGAGSPDLAECVAASMAEHFIHDLQHYLRKWSHSRLAKYLEKRLPISKRAKSGDFGEIVATEIIRGQKLEFEIPINRLCWKDCPLPMRGDDILGFDFSANNLRVLKAESKSGKNITVSTVTKARAALNKNGGAPSSHSLTFIMERLHDSGRDTEADKIEPWVLDRSLSKRQITHCIFVASANGSAIDAIRMDAAGVKAPLSYIGFALRLADHAGVVEESYKLAVKDA